MKKLFTLAAIAALSVSSAAYAVDHSDIAADKGAIAKDDQAIGEQDANIATNRKEKAAAKANGDYAGQASQSVQIGANKSVKAEKNGEKNVDQKVLSHHKKKMTNMEANSEMK